MSSGLGFIKLERSLLQSPIYRDHPAEYFLIYVHLKFEAAWQETEVDLGIFGKVRLLPGQLVTTAKKIAESCRTTESTSKRALIVLQKLGLTNCKPTNKYTVITITESITYTESNDIDRTTDRTSKTDTTEPRTDPPTGLRIGLPYKEEEVKEKRERAKISPPSPAEVTAYSIETGHQIDGQAFCNFYGSKGWMVGKNRMTNWHLAVGTWQGREKRDGIAPPARQHPEPEPQYVRPTEWLPDPNEPDYDFGPNGEIIEIPKSAKAVANGLN